MGRGPGSLAFVEFRRDSEGNACLFLPAAAEREDLPIISLWSSCLITVPCDQVRALLKAAKSAKLN